MSTQPSPAHFPGERRWHAAFPALAAALTMVALVATVAFAGFAARQLSVAADRQAAVNKLRGQLAAATGHLERANRLLGATAKVVQVTAEVQRIDQTLGEQKKMAAALEKTTADTVAALKGDRKSIAKLRAETKAQLAAIAEKEKELLAARDPLANQLSEELARMLAAFADEAAKAQKGAAPKEAPAGQGTADGEKAAAVPPAAENAGEGRKPAEQPATGAEAPAAGGGEAPKTAVRPGRDSGSGTGKQVEP